MIPDYTEISREDALLWLDRHLQWYMHADVMARADDESVTILDAEGPLAHWSDDLVPGAEVDPKQAEPLAGHYRIGMGKIDLGLLDGPHVVFARHDYLDRLLILFDRHVELTLAASHPVVQGDA
jgi:hypothetical protein